MPKHNLDDLLFFITLVDEGSITAAAKKLDLAKSNLSRKLNQLERDYGAELLIRTTRKQHLTESGKLLYQVAKPHIDALGQLEETIAEQTGEAKGLLKLLLPVEFYNPVISKLCCEFAAQYPHITLHCSQYSASPEQLASSGWNKDHDLCFVLHEQNLPDANWIAKSLLSFPQSLYVHDQSSIYKQLSQLNVITLADLEQIPAIVSSDHETWCFRDKATLHVYEPYSRVAFPSPEMRIQALNQQLGVAKLPDYILSGVNEFKPLATRFPLLALKLSVLYQSRHLPLKTRLFLDFFQSQIGAF